MSKWAYDYTDEELLDEFQKATARAGVSGSGLVIDMMAGHHALSAYYLYGVVLSRLKGLKPPFSRGDRVRISPTNTYHCGSVNHGVDYSRGTAKPDEVYTVERTFYESNHRWTLQFKETEEFRFPAVRFEKAPARPVAV